MKTTKVWNLKYFAGNTGRLFSDASNPQRRTDVLVAARQVEANGWRAWVEHSDTGRRIFESKQEREHRESNPRDVGALTGTSAAP